MTDTAPETRGGFPEIKPVEMPPELGRFVAAIRRLQDLTVSTNPDGPMWATAAEHVENACTLLEDHQVPEGLAPAGRVIDLPGLGHPLLPPWTITDSGPDGVTMKGHFTRSHVGGNNAGVWLNGGGVIQLELSWLMTAQNFPFLSTLIHELGHAFGLTHADCHGYDMETNGSMMAYNTPLWSKDFSLSAPPPVFNPEEYLMLAQNKLAFPNFNFIPARHNPRGKSLATADSCTLGWMDETIGEYRDMPGMGFELFWDGERINGPEAAFFSRQEARECVRNGGGGGHRPALPAGKR